MNNYPDKSCLGAGWFDPWPSSTSHVPSLILHLQYHLHPLPCRLVHCSCSYGDVLYAPFKAWVFAPLWYPGTCQVFSGTTVEKVWTALVGFFFSFLPNCTIATYHGMSVVVFLTADGPFQQFSKPTISSMFFGQWPCSKSIWSVRWSLIIPKRVLLAPLNMRHVRYSYFTSVLALVLSVSSVFSMSATFIAFIFAVSK